MNLNEINTTADLFAANAQPEPNVPAETVKELLFKLEAAEAAEILKEAVANLAIWHQAEAADSEDPKRAAAWAADEGRLHVALLALNEVNFG